MSAARKTLEVAVCTYRRAGIVDTLASLARQNVPEGWEMSILVVDNDDRPSGENRVAAFAATAPVPMRYIHRPAGNISIARNGALDAARGRYLAFIDDDETADPGWLAALVATQAETGADVVLGPVRAVYSADAPVWMRRLDAHSAAPVDVAGTIRTGYSCNVLIDRSAPAFRGLRFDPGLGRSGGEDTAYFTHAFRRGARFAEAPGAVVREAVPTHRARFFWLARRRFRSGQTHGRLLAETGRGPSRAAAAGTAALKVLYCLGHAALAAPDAARRNGALLRGTLHAGTLSGLFGARPITLYGASEGGMRP
ncbi:MAG: glycosyltransferase family 2 protein [Paracoccaceae bacterium]|nr:glycosyltransferase family 2 protein [Paracoccaceae bacterium]